MTRSPGATWRFASLWVPFLLVALAVPVLALAALLSALQVDGGLALRVAVLGGVCWAAGIGWGILADQVRPAVKAA